jgi:fido (protein-threonine AMPylation protein)
MDRINSSNMDIHFDQHDPTGMSGDGNGNGNDERDEMDYEELDRLQWERELELLRERDRECENALREFEEEEREDEQQMSMVRQLDTLDISVLHHLYYCFDNLSFGNLSVWSVTTLLENILKGRQNYVRHRDALMDVLKSNYVREAWISESPPAPCIDTVAVADSVVEGVSPTTPSVDEHTWTKVANIHSALNTFVLDGSMNEAEFFENLDLEFVYRVHRVIGNHVIPTAGHLRKKTVGATGSWVRYTNPEAIELHLKTLLAFVREKARTAPAPSQSPQSDMDRVSYMIKLGSIFFSEFLLIHPFANGNGRTARILLNAILKHVVVVPFSLYLNNRDEYLNVLQKRNDRTTPVELAGYILQAINKTSADVNWLANQM